MGDGGGEAGLSAGRWSYHPVTRAVAVGLRRRCEWRRGERRRAVVAVSGGADSVALLRVLRLLSGRRGWPIELTAGHVQHHLRGEAGEADARWVEERCAELGVRFERADVEVGPGNVESAARRARYAALGAIARRVEADEVLTAHTATDQWETLLMRVSRGTGLAGLSGIASRTTIGSVVAVGEGDRSIAVGRPMLTVTREAVRAFLTELGQGWREDETNADAERRARARLRRDVLPALRELYPGAEAAAGRLADAAAMGLGVSREPESPWGWVGERWVAARSALDRRETRRAEAASAIRGGLQRAGAPMGRIGSRAIASIVDAVRDGVGGARRFELAGGWVVEVTRDAVTISRPAG